MNRPEKIIFIKRKQTFIEQANSDPEVAEYFNMSYRAIGSFYKSTGKQFGTGLTKKEENLLMPEMIGFFADLDKREYHRAVADFYRNINTKIPPEGLRLNIALEQPDKELGDENPPVSLRDYILYKHAAAHPETAANYEEAEMYQHKRFYIEDTDFVLDNASGLSEKEDTARLEYYAIAENNDKVEQMLVLLGVDTKKMKLDEKKLVLKSFTTINDKQTSTVNEHKLDKFIEISVDKRLKIKYEIEEMIRVDVLERVGQKILITETGDLLGDDLKEAALWFEDKGNSKDTNVLRARYKEFKK